MNPIADFAYPVSRLHSIENKMLDTKVLNSMCETNSIEDAYKILSDHGYDIDLSNLSGYNEMLGTEMDKTYELIAKLIPDHEYFWFFLLKKDYQNLKVLFKAERTTPDHSNLLEDGGVYPKDKMIEYVRERNYSKLTKTMIRSIDLVMDVLAKTNDSQMIDIIFDSAYFEDSLISAVKIGNKFLIDFIKLNIDLTNIKSYIRVEKLDLGSELLSKILISSGNKSKETYLVTSDKFFSEFNFSKYNLIVEQGLEAVKKGDSLSLFEKMIDDHIIGSIKKCKYEIFGIEPVIAHIIAKEFELKNVRIVLSGIINNLGAAAIKERIRSAYA